MTSDKTGSAQSDEKTLHLVLKKKWFDMIASGEKTEEYRAITPYWSKRLCATRHRHGTILFRNGYAKTARTLLIELHSVGAGLGIVEWGAPYAETVFILYLGNILKEPRQ